MRPRSRGLASPIVSTALVCACVMAGCGAEQTAERLRVTVHATYPHDPGAFTQGLEYEDGTLFESTGGIGTSTVREVDLQTGTVIRSRDLPGTTFGEGIAVDGDRIVQLTWRDGIAFVFDRVSLKRTASIRYRGEGWGLCRNELGLVMSDGTADLVIRDPIDFQERRRVSVRLDGRPVTQLNELECVGDDVYANVWQTDQIMRIDLSSGRVEAVIDASSLPVARTGDPDAVLNGIAYLRERDRFLVTGKLWPSMFEVTFDEGSDR